jgi:hypothetical protein
MKRFIFLLVAGLAFAVNAQADSGSPVYDINVTLTFTPNSGYVPEVINLSFEMGFVPCPTAAAPNCTGSTGPYGGIIVGTPVVTSSGALTFTTVGIGNYENFVSVFDAADDEADLKFLPGSMENETPQITYTEIEDCKSTTCAAAYTNGPAGLPQDAVGTVTGTVVLEKVPEPAIISLLCAGLLSLAMMRRKSLAQ